MDVIILAGGFGKRLEARVKDVPKPMADVLGRPFLSFLLDHLLNHGVTKILMSVGYKYEIVQTYFGPSYRGADIQYIVEDHPLGTGGALRKALPFSRDENSIVLNGDTLFTVDLKRMFEFHLSRRGALTLAVKPMRDILRYGTVQLKGDRVVGFREKEPLPFGYINGGVYVVNRSIAKYFDPRKESFSFEVDFLPQNLDNIRPCAYISDVYFIDIGIPEDYAKAQNDFGLISKKT